MLEAVTSAGIAATAFLQGRWALAEPIASRALSDTGWLIGNHSHHHAPFPVMSPAGRRADIEEAREAILETSGVDPRPWFRLPFGRGQGDERIAHETRVLGYHAPVGWDVDPEDWSGLSGEAIRTTIRDAIVRRTADTVVLLHSWPDGTRDAIPGIARDARDLGHELVRLDELVGS